MKRAVIILGALAMLGCESKTAEKTPTVDTPVEPTKEETLYECPATYGELFSRMFPNPLEALHLKDRFPSPLAQSNIECQHDGNGLRLKLTTLSNKPALGRVVFGPDFRIDAIITEAHYGWSNTVQAIRQPDGTLEGVVFDNKTLITLENGKITNRFDEKNPPPNEYKAAMAKEVSPLPGKPCAQDAVCVDLIGKPVVCLACDENPLVGEMPKESSYRSRFHYTYDGDKLVQVDYDRNALGLFSKRTRYKYDDQGRETEQIREKLDGFGVATLERFRRTLEFYPDGSPKRGESDRNGDGKVDYQVTYDQSGERLTEKRDRNDDGEFDVFIEYKKNDKGQRVRYVDRDGDGKWDSENVINAPEPKDDK